MTKKIKKLERESLEWQLKWKKCNTSIVDMVKERTAIVLSCSRLMKQNTKLQQLGLTLCDQLRREHGKLRSCECDGVGYLYCFWCLNCADVLHALKLFLPNISLRTLHLWTVFLKNNSTLDIQTGSVKNLN